MEIDSAKSDVKPDLSEYLVTNKAPKSLFLKCKSLIEKQNERRSWYEKTYGQQFRELFKNTDWSSVSSNLERLPLYAYELKRNTPKAKEPPAPDNEIFTFAQNPDWKSDLDKKKLNRVSALLDDYEHCLKRIRNSRNRSDIPERKSDIERILFMRGQENDYDTDELYSLFTDFTPGEIEEIYTQMQECKWQFMLPEETKAKIFDFTTAPSTAYALETLIKYYYANRQKDTDWVVLPVANFDAYFGSTSFSKKRLTELVKSGAIERENSYNVSRYRVNEAFLLKFHTFKKVLFLVLFCP